MDKILRFLEMHAGVIIILLLVILILDVLFSLIIKQKNVHDLVQKRKNSSGQFYDEILWNNDEVFILLCRKNRCVTYVSANIEKILGIKQEDVMADLHVLEKITARKYIRGVEKQIEKWDKKSLLEIELAYHKAYAEDEHWGKVQLMLTEDGENYLCKFIDITKEHEKHLEMEREIQKAYENDQSKTRFLSKMSHEIRTPMNGMLGMISLAKMNMDHREEAEDYLDKAENMSQFLLSIINDVLDMSRIESGKIELAYERVDIFSLAGKLKDMFQVTVEDKGIKFELELQDFTIRYVVGDELRISQILTNFLSNASKFTSAGGQITLSFRQMHIIGNRVNLMMRVRDTGKGMSPEFMSKIFNPFEQEDATVAKNYGGSGLGMAISDNLVQLMGGHITVDSEPGRGTDFTVFLELPIAEGDQTLPDAGRVISEEKSGEDTFSIKGMRILLAEDNKINLNYS
ncbi:MAG: hypothetical protein EOM40_18950 [Clostridia bacterium]|nr:hypothetical protein [Clostridia bacterium]